MLPTGPTLGGVSCGFKRSRHSNIEVSQSRKSVPWLLAGGASLKGVMDRMGHAQIQTTQKYLHTLPDTDQKNLDALTRIAGVSVRVRHPSNFGRSRWSVDPACGLCHLRFRVQPGTANVQGQSEVLSMRNAYLAVDML